MTLETKTTFKYYVTRWNEQIVDWEVVEKFDNAQNAENYLEAIQKNMPQNKYSIRVEQTKVTYFPYKSAHIWGNFPD